MKNVFSLLIKYNELFFWVGALTFLYFITPENTHFTLCPLALLDFSFCPGCGLGESIHYLMHGEIGKSFSTHLLAIPAVLILLNRIFNLSNPLIICIKESYKKYPA
ncbi:DUF2752 domain-containing protein [Marinigracilibium pacificum]|uniref:DUF2752 domain-containing protein n=1 Tax=Marinigracilibium pacificum TaxID=2729599 RepID=A0A848J0H3_9BACT|nr:DUF2752 domain-containing protein [Marinigracilibium pacificum]NMM48868.1 DUF2752 domain-containing protein [Marinigracilibium pacificum]